MKTLEEKLAEIANNTLRIEAIEKRLDELLWSGGAPHAAPKTVDKPIPRPYTWDDGVVAGKLPPDYT